MGLAEGVNRVRRRLLTEWFHLEPIVEPPLPRADWNLTTPTKQTADGAEMDEETRLRVLSLNVWGLPVAPHCTERAVEIGNAIDGKFDVVVLQEVWHRRERNLIIARAEKAGFHFYHYFQPAVGFPVPFGPDSFGTGLLVLSRYPICSAMYHSFALTGRPYALHEADFVANKGIGLLRIQSPRGEIDLYVTHLLANYNDLGAPGPGDRYLAHRVAQSYELERFVEATNRNELTLVCGDFNSPPDCVVLRIPRELRQLRDAFTDMNNHDGLTFATEDNKFSHGEHPMRMDYILYKRNNPGTPTDPNHKGWHLVGSDVYKGFFTNAKGEQCPLSDHFGVTAEFAFGPMHKLVKPCESSQSKASDNEAGLTVIFKSGCATTTCIHCDSVEAKDQAKAKKLGPDGLTTVERCLQDVQHSLLQGRADAAHRRVSSLRRSGFSFFAAIALVITHLCAVYLSEWVWVVALLLLFYSVVHYVLAFFFVTLECSTFTELASEVRLHLHAEHAQNTASPNAL